MAHHTHAKPVVHFSPGTRAMVAKLDESGSRGISRAIGMISGDGNLVYHTVHLPKFQVEGEQWDTMVQSAHRGADGKLHIFCCLGHIGPNSFLEPTCWDPDVIVRILAGDNSDRATSNISESTRPHHITAMRRMQDQRSNREGC